MQSIRIILAAAAIMTAANVQAQAPKFKRGDVNQDNTVNSSDVPALESSMSRFKRGDANQDGSVNVSDVNYIQSWLFQGGPAPTCLDAADANDDGQNNQADSIYLLNWLFQGGPAPPAPGPFTCGTDPTGDGLSCQCGDACGDQGLSCRDAADVNDDGVIDCADRDYLNSYLFGGGPAPPAPGPTTCGTDPTADGLGCTSPICP